MTLLLSIILSFLAVRGFRFEFGAKILELRNTESFVWLLLFLYFVWVITKFLKCKNTRLKLYSILFGIIIAAFQVIGGSLERMTGISWIWQNRSMLVNFLNMYFSFAFLFSSFAFLAFLWLDKNSLQKSGIAIKMNKKRVLFVWIILLICYIPWYLYFYPGVLTYDSGAQVHDALTINSISDHNPAFVTLLIRAVIVPMMKLTGSIVVSVGSVTLLQMLIVTFVFALSYERICRYISNTIIRILFLIWFAFYPVNNIYSFTMWKDIPFSICLLGFSLCLDAAAPDEKAFFEKKRNCFWMFLTMALLPLLRHNGMPIIAGMSIYMIFQFKNARKKTVIISCSALIIFGLWKMLILPAMHASTSPSSELLNVPIQQISRVLSNHSHEVSPWLIEDIQQYFKKPEFWEDYWEKIADPVKGQFISSVYDEDPGKFFSLWARLGRQYPIEYLEAYLQGNYGYWYPETTWWITGRGVIINIDIPGLVQAPIIRLNIIDKIYNWYINGQYNKTPILPLFFKPGAIWWAWVFCGFYCLYQNRKKFLLFLPGLFLWLPLQFSAVYCEFRYSYGLFVCLPLLLASTLKKFKQ